MQGSLPAALIYIIPFIIGNALLFLFQKLGKQNDGEKVHYFSSIDCELTSSRIINFFESFALGSLVIYIIALLSAATIDNGLISTSFTLLFSHISLVVFLLCLAALVIRFTLNLRRFDWQSFMFSTVTFSVLAFISVAIYLIWRWDSPLNTTLNWDLYAHQTLINVITEGKFSFTTLSLSDTFRFNAYSTFFHTLLSLPLILIKTNVLAFWWFAEFFHFVTTVFASYVISYELSKSRKIGIITAIIGALIFESFVSYTSFFLIPQNVAATVSIVLLARVLHRKSSNKPLLDFPLFLILIFLLLMHVPIGFTGMILTVVALLYFWIVKTSDVGRFGKFTLILSASLLLILPLIFSKIDLGYINRGEAVYFNFDLAKKLAFMKDFYGFSFLVFAPIGIFVLLKKRDVKSNLFLVLFFLTLSIVVSSFPYSLKFYSITRYFSHSLMAVGFYTLIKGLSKKLQVACTLLLSATLLITLIINTETYKQTPHYKEMSSHVSPNEIGAANFLKEKYSNQNVLLVSDPATMFILEGLSGINTPGGAYAQESTRRTLSNIYFSRDSKKIGSELSKVSDFLGNKSPEKTLFAVSGRYTKWVLADDSEKFGIYWNPWTPMDLTLRECDLVCFIQRYTKFKEVFRNGGIVIFEVKK